MCEYIFFIVVITTLQLTFTFSQSQCESSNQEGFKYIPFNNGSGFVAILGNVNDVLEGIIHSSVNSTFWTNEGTGRFGFGAAAIGTLEGLGDVVYANGIAAVRPTDNRTEDYFQTITGREFRSPFSVFIPEGSSPNGNAQFFTQSDSRHITMTDFYERLYDAVGEHPFCYYGLTEFAQLEGIAVSKAPIYGDALLGEAAASYYTEPNFQLSNEYGLTIGCAANFSNILDSALTLMMSKFLYSNPKDADNIGELVVHSHALSLRRCLTSPDEIDLTSVNGVYHVLSNTTMTFISANVYIIDHIDKVIELKATSNSQKSLIIAYVYLISFIAFISIVHLNMDKLIL